MKLLCSALIVLILSTNIMGEEYIIDDYSFEWKVESIGEVKLSLEKENDKISVNIKTGSSFSTSYLFLTPKEAVSIGKKLLGTEKYYKKQKKSKSDISDKVKAGKYRIVFSTSSKYGFYVSISEDRAFSDGIILNRKEARKLSKLLVKSNDMASFLKKEIDF